MIHFVIMYMIHIIQDIHIINVFKFAFKCMLTLIFVNVIKTNFI